LYHVVVIMKTKKQQKQFFLVLVPHRDARVELRRYRDNLINKGLTGVYSFPLAAPLGTLSHALSTDELKHIACSLRRINGNNKINAAEISSAAFPSNKKGLSLLGARLNQEIPADIFYSASEKITSVLPHPIIGAFLLPEDSDNPQLNISFPPVPQLSFRAAAVANMYWQSFKEEDQTGYKWKIGKLCWLPRSCFSDSPQLPNKSI